MGRLADMLSVSKRNWGCFLHIPVASSLIADRKQFTIMCPSKIWHSRVPNLYILEIVFNWKKLTHEAGALLFLPTFWCKYRVFSLLFSLLDSIMIHLLLKGEPQKAEMAYAWSTSQAHHQAPPQAPPQAHHQIPPQVPHQVTVSHSRPTMRIFCGWSKLLAIVSSP